MALCFSKQFMALHRNKTCSMRSSFSTESAVLASACGFVDVLPLLANTSRACRDSSFASSFARLSSPDGSANRSLIVCYKCNVGRQIHQIGLESFLDNIEPIKDERYLSANFTGWFLPANSIVQLPSHPSDTRSSVLASHRHNIFSLLILTSSHYVSVIVVWLIKQIMYHYYVVNKNKHNWPITAQHLITVGHFCLQKT